MNRADRRRTSIGRGWIINESVRVREFGESTKSARSTKALKEFQAVRKSPWVQTSPEIDESTERTSEAKCATRASVRLRLALASLAASAGQVVRGPSTKSPIKNERA